MRAIQLRIRNPVPYKWERYVLVRCFERIQISIRISHPSLCVEAIKAILLATGLLTYLVPYWSCMSERRCNAGALTIVPLFATLSIECKILLTLGREEEC